MHGPYFFVTAALCFLCVTTVLIVLHEFGHYLSARAFGLKAQAFSMGFGPELAGFTDRNGTRWKICPIPLGGYVKFHGEMHPGTGKDDEASHPQSFAKLARWKRAIVIFAGPFVNIVICAVILGGLFTAYGEPRISPLIQQVLPGSPAASAGIQAGDRLISWDGNAPTGDQQMIRHIKVNPGANIDLVFDRHGERREMVVPIARQHFADRFGNKAEIGRVGIMFKTEMRAVTGPIDLLQTAVRETSDLFSLQVETIGQLVTGRRSLDEVSGPVRLAKFAGEQYLEGWTAVIYFTGILSIAVAFMNLLPVPGLDGGYLALYAIEGAMQRDLPKKVFMNAIKVGYVCVFGLMIFAFSNDFRVLFMSS